MSGPLRLEELTPEVIAGSANGTFGLPRSFHLSADGATVVFLRSAGPDDPVNSLWVARADDGWDETLLFDASAAGDAAAGDDVLAERLRERGAGVTRFSCDAVCSRIVFQLGGAVWLRADGACEPLAGVDPGAAALVSPDGSSVAVARGSEIVVHSLPDGAVVARAAGASPGVPDFVAAEEIHRYEGMWWSPDSRRLLAQDTDTSGVPEWTIAEPGDPATPAQRVPYPAAGGPNAVVSLLLLDCSSDEATRVEWDHEELPYLWNVVWTEAGGLTVELEPRDQTRLVTFDCDVSSGALTERASVVQEPWVEPGNGTRAHSPEGELCRVLDLDGVRTLAIGERRAQLPPGAHATRFLGRLADGCLVQVAHHPAERSLALVGWDGSYAEIGERGRVAIAAGRGSTVVVQERSLEGSGIETTVRAGASSVPLRSNAHTYAWEERVEFLELDGGRVRSALMLPSWHQPGAGSLPLLVSSYGGPLSPRVLRDRVMRLADRWLAEQGFAVLATDGVGSGGGPRLEAEIRGDFAQTLDSQVAAVRHVIAERDDVDGERVGIRGWSFGGYLAALAAIRAPDVFHAAVAGAPVSDWMLYDTHYTERYLGVGEELERNARASSLEPLLEGAGEVAPLLLIHGLSDDNVFAAHTVRLSEALIRHGVLHSALLPSALTHVSRGSLTAGILRLEAAFLASHLGATPWSAPPRLRR